MLVPPMTVAENVVSAPSRGGAGLLDREAAAPVARARRSATGLPVDPDAGSRTCRSACSSGWRSSRRCYRDAQVLILDEPTAVLTPAGGRRAVRRPARLRGAGHGGRFITHKLREVIDVGDASPCCATAASSPAWSRPRPTGAEIARHMTGRAVDLDGATRRRARRATPVLHGRGPHRRPPNGAPGGRRRLAVRAGGRDRRDRRRRGQRPERARWRRSPGCGPRAPGRCASAAADLHGCPPARRREAGVAYMPEDRAATGRRRAPGVADNLAMGDHRPPPLRRGLAAATAARAGARRAARSSASRSRCAPRRCAAGTLSGGNLQKAGASAASWPTQAPAARWSSSRPAGVDIGAHRVHPRPAAARYRDARPRRPAGLGRPRRARGPAPTGCW